MTLTLILPTTLPWLVALLPSNYENSLTLTHTHRGQERRQGLTPSSEEKNRLNVIIGEKVWFEPRKEKADVEPPTRPSDDLIHRNFHDDLIICLHLQNVHMKQMLI